MGRKSICTNVWVRNVDNLKDSEYYLWSDIFESYLFYCKLPRYNSKHILLSAIHCPITEDLSSQSGPQESIITEIYELHRFCH